MGKQINQLLKHACVLLQVIGRIPPGQSNNESGRQLGNMAANNWAHIMTNAPILPSPHGEMGRHQYL